MNEKDEKTWKAITVARSKIAHLSGNFVFIPQLKLYIETWLGNTHLKLNMKEKAVF